MAAGLEERKQNSKCLKINLVSHPACGGRFGETPGHTPKIMK